MDVTKGAKIGQFEIGKNIEQEMIKILKKGSKGYLLVAQYQGKSVFIVNNEIKNHEKFIYELRLLIKSYI